MKELLKNLKFVWQYAKREKKRIIFLIFFNLFNIVFSIITPILSAKIIISLTSNNFNRIVLLAIAILIINILYDISDYLSRILSISIYRVTLSTLEIDVCRYVLKIENSCLDRDGSGLYIKRLTNDTSRIAEVFNQVLNMLSRMIKYTGILVAIFIVNKIVFIYIFSMLVILYILEKIRTDRRKEDDKVTRKAEEKVSGFVGELVRGARDIKMLNSENDFIKELGVRIDDANYKNMKMRRTSWNYKLGIWSIMDTCEFLLIVLLVILMKRNFIVATTALILFNYSRETYGTIFLLGDLFEYVKDFNLSCERVSDIIYSKDFRKEKFGKKFINKINGDFEFKNVSFGYNKDKKILNKLNFKIHANETVAFVGKSGAGKTTIFNLLCKMYDVNSGSIMIDGMNINELDRDSIRGNITIISQNPYIFNMSIKDNLKLVKSDLTDKEMKEACKIACLEDFIKELPNGYDTIIGEGGVNLSGGQKQRLAIARALVQKTEIILFDEATSALDNETQKKIQDAIDNMKNEYTILIIAHRLSTIINSDRILFIDNGRVKAEGTHKELLKNCNEYKKLYESEISKD